jgi:glycosyltransferase involved in cell wall biosynthesis
MKIRILTPEYPPTFGGGVATFYQALAPQFAAAGHSVEVVQGSAVFCSSGSVKGRRDGVDIYTLEEARLRKHFTRFAHFTPISGAARHLAAAWAMWEKSEELGDADIVEGCDWGLSFIPAILSRGRPVVAQMHGSVGQINRHDPIAGEEAAGVAIRLMEVAALQRAAEIQTYSQANARFWSGQTGRPTVHIAPAWRMPREPVASTPLSASGLVLGRVQEWKGPQVLCDALLRLGRTAPSVDWVGRDTVSRRLDRSASKSLAHDHPHIWGSRVRHVPQVAPAEAWRFQCQARFIVVPSTWDVFNFTCVEAMASGRPVICSSGAGASELIVDGVNGFLFPNGDASALAAAIDRVLALSETRVAEMAEAARATLARKLDPERVAASRLQRYAHVIAHFRPKPAVDDDWLLEACSAREEAAADLAYLDHQPLRSLLGYSARRLAVKMTRRAHV